MTVLGWVISGGLTGGLALAGVFFVQRRTDRARDHERRSEVYTELLAAVRPLRAPARRIRSAPRPDHGQGSAPEAGWRVTLLDSAVTGSRSAVGDGAAIHSAIEKFEDLAIRIETASFDPDLIGKARSVVAASENFIEMLKVYPEQIDAIRLYREATFVDAGFIVLTRTIRRELGLMAPRSKKRWWKRVYYRSRDAITRAGLAVSASDGQTPTPGCREGQGARNALRRRGRSSQDRRQID